VARSFSWLGIGFIGFGLFVLLVAIPYAVTSPSNVRAVVLSPTFWPTIISWLIIGLGALIVVFRMFKPVPELAEEGEAPADHGTAGPWLRLLASAVIMVGLVLVTPTLGLVWTAMIAFALLSLVIRAPQPVLSAIVAIALPLILYAFFAHVAGVAVPQGEFIRLP
jgi:putative tricarboxylic transport membrane protein